MEETVAKKLWKPISQGQWPLCLLKERSINASTYFQPLPQKREYF